MQPFPWHALPRIPRAEARLLDQASAALDVRSLEDARSTLGALLGVEVSARPGPVAWVDVLGRALAPTLVAVIGEAASGRWALELPPSLALALVDRVLGGDGAPAPVPGLLDAVERGVIAYVAARLGVGEVHDVLTTREGLEAWLGDEGCVGWSIQLGLDGRSGAARLWWPARVVRAGSLGAVRAAGALPGWIDEVPVTVALRMGRACLDGRALGALARGDVLVPDELTYWPEHEALRAARLVADGWCADVERTVEGWRVRAVARAAAGVRGRIGAEGGAMSEPGDDEARGRVEDVPVEVAIELGRLELRVRELAALVPGRIVSARVPVGGAVTLRAGDRVIATGELVDLEGELGVRIVAVQP